jgi:hypothetical protein
MTMSGQDQDQVKSNDKELNFRAMEQKLERENAARLQAERERDEALARLNTTDDDDENDPYIDTKKFNKKISALEKQWEQKFDRKAEEKANSIIQKKEQESWLNRNSDFTSVMQHAEKLYIKDPELAEAILKMPDSFERQQLVYKNIKALGLHEAPKKESSIQEKVDANRRSPFYQPTSIAAAPYNQASDFSPSGQKNAYDKMQELKSRLRLG